MNCDFCENDKMCPAMMIMAGMYVGVWFCIDCYHVQDVDDSDLDYWEKTYNAFRDKISDELHLDEISSFNNDTNPDFN